MTFHQEYERYSQAGVISIDDMLNLSKSNITGTDVNEAAELGFDADVEFLRLVRQKSNCGIWTHFLRDYALAGFAGDKQAVVELSEDVYKDCDGLHPIDYVVSPDYALFLAEHGLKGDKEAMKDVTRQVSYDRLHILALEIAYGLLGKSYIQSCRESTETPEAMEQRRKDMASEIPVRSLVLLATYDWGKNWAWQKTSMYDALGKAETTEQKDAINDQIDAFENELLIRMFKELRESGEEAFTRKYQKQEEADKGYQVLNKALEGAERSERMFVLDSYLLTDRAKREEILSGYGLVVDEVK